MKYTQVVVVAALAVLAHAQNSRGQEEYLASVCSPNNSSNLPDLDAPCNAIAAIQAQCIYGPSWLSSGLGSLEKRQNDNGNSDDGYGDDGDLPMQSNETQRVCLCQSQFWDQANGCFSCYKKHGESDGVGSIGEDQLSSLSSGYCAATVTPTAGLADYLYALASSLEPSTTFTGQAHRSSASFLDAIGNKTDVSLYFTPSVTGSAAWSVVQPTGSASSVVYSTTNVDDGQIRATASANNAAGSDGSDSRTDSGAQSTQSGSSAGRQEAMAAAVILGLVGLLAVL